MIFTKADAIFPFSKIDINSARQDRATSNVRDLIKDALHYHCTHDVISEILPGISKLNFSGILLMISTKFDETFLF